MNPTDVRKQIRSGDTAPLYLLEGDDLQSRHDMALEFSSLVDEGLQAFNVESFHAIEATTIGSRDRLLGDILSAARTLPMMASRRLVIVHEAERLLSPRKSKDDEDEPGPAVVAGSRKSRGPTAVDELAEYLEGPEPMTTLVFVSGALDANRRLVKLVRRHALVVDCGTLKTPGEAAKWIQQRLGKDDLTIDAQAVSLLLEATGLSLGRIRAEVEKLALYAAGAGRVTSGDVRDLLIPQAEPGEGPAVGLAIRQGDAKRALQELSALHERGVPFPMVLGQIRWAAGQLRPDARVKRALDLVLDCDLGLKSSAGEPRFLLERLVVELCAARG